VDDTGVTNTGWSASFMFTPIEELRIGFNYRSEILLNAEGGEAVFSNFPNSTLTPQNGTTTFNATLPLPAELTLGFAYEPNEKWLFAFDYQRAFWDVYNSLDIEFGNPNVPTSINPRNYKNASIYRFGAQYKATDDVTLRAGLLFRRISSSSWIFLLQKLQEMMEMVTQQAYPFRFTEKLAMMLPFCT